jgi:hypothetical protein
VVDIQQRFTAIRQEIDGLKAILQVTSDAATRYILLTRLNECICESIRLVEQRLQPYVDNSPADEPASSPAPLLERHVGESPLE